MPLDLRGKKKQEPAEPPPITDPRVLQLRNKLLAVAERVLYAMPDLGGDPQQVSKFLEGMENGLAQYQAQIPSVYAKVYTVFTGVLEDDGVGNINRMLDIVNGELKVVSKFEVEFAKGWIWARFRNPQLRAILPPLIGECGRILEAKVVVKTGGARSAPGAPGP